LARVRCFVTLVLVAVLIGIGFVNLATLPGDVANAPNAGDIALYKRIIAHVQGGESYYTAAVRELRENNYPLRPFVVVRPPFWPSRSQRSPRRWCGARCWPCLRASPFWPGRGGCALLSHRRYCMRSP
jgi:hypothetical protein